MKPRLVIVLTTTLATVALVLAVPNNWRAPNPEPIPNSINTSVASVSSPDPALPLRGNLTFGASTGTALIGLTVRPAEPGPNTLLVYVLPLAGQAAAAQVRLALSVNGRNVMLDACSPTCRTADMDLVGGEHVDITTDAGTAAFELPGLPPQDGTELLQRVQQHMHQLQTYRVAETLGPASPPLQADYVYEAPDRMRLTPAKGETTVWIGSTRYSRPVNSHTWEVENFGSSLPVPSFIWEIPESSGTYVAAHIVGTATVDGLQTRILTFFLKLPQNPVWFRLWADADGLVHHASMRAQGHFMEHVYTQFDDPPSIEPPV